MATILTPPTGPDGKRDYRYSSTGVDLTAPVKFNPNPLDIESFGGRNKGYTQEKWSAFLRFADSKINKNDTSLNSQAVWEKLTTDLIKEFNTSPESNWVKFGSTSPNRGLQNPLTREDIFAIQRFTNKVDPNAQIDGWLGTQTLRMEYPKLRIIQVVNEDKDKNILNGAPELLIPVVWGNKRYVITYSDYEAAGTDVAKIVEKMELYDPTIHTKDKFYNNVNNYKEWTALEPTVIVSQSADQVNSNTTKQNINKKISSLQTEIKKVITK